jgi:ornithine cyclodeaminase/alanine dehydrogenase-like protein (mu-crystallin family)
MTAPRYVTEEEIRALCLTPAEVRAALEPAFAARARGEVDLPTKIGVHSRAGSIQHAMPVVYGDLAAVKWVSIGSRPVPPPAPYIHAELVLSDAANGRTIAIMDARWITAIRTAAVSAIAAMALGPPGADTLAILGAGLQARTHLDALRDVFPLRRLRVASRRAESIAALSRAREAEGLAVEPIGPEALFRETGLLLTAISGKAPAESRLDAHAITGQLLVLAVDLGFSWDASRFDAFDTIVTDDRAHTGGVTEHGLIPPLPRVDADLAEICAGRRPPRGGKVLVLAPGVALADVALAGAIARRLGLC